MVPSADAKCDKLLAFFAGQMHLVFANEDSLRVLTLQTLPPCSAAAISAEVGMGYHGFHVAPREGGSTTTLGLMRRGM
jgi:hypothetical protein